MTPELKEYEEKVLNAEEKRTVLEHKLFEALREEIVRASAQIRSAAESVAQCDVLLAFAKSASIHRYSRPLVEESEQLELVGARHPVVEQMLDGDTFVANDIYLDRENAQLMIITGPNMAGKSTVMRQTALAVLMAQAGSFVAAEKATIGLTDRIFTRVGASDNLAKGQSTFMVEMTETSNILNHATARSLVILDEIGRGTSTFDGLSLAWAIAEHLHDAIGARTLFATHYHELTDLARECRRVKNYSMAVSEEKGRVIFLRKLVEGGANRSYGIEVARLAGLPSGVLARAREILANLESGELDEVGQPRLTRKHLNRERIQLKLFEETIAPETSLSRKKILEEIEHLSIDDLTPLQALNLVSRFKDNLNG